MITAAIAASLLSRGEMDSLSLPTTLCCLQEEDQSISLVRGQSHIWAANSACNGNPSKEAPLIAPSACGLGNQGWLEERGTSDWRAANQRETLPESERWSLRLSLRKSLLHVSVILMNKWHTVDEHMEDGAHFVNPSTITTIERSRDAGVVSLGDLSLAGEQSDHVTLEAICH